MVTIDDFTKFKYLDYGKVFLVLYFKGFSWKKELQNEFNISNSVVSKALQVLEENGFIIAKDFWSLDLDSQEAIKRLNAGYSYLIKRHPKIYTLSTEGREEGGYIILEELKEKAKIHSSLQATIEFVQNKTKAYNLVKKQFEKIENSEFSRKRIDHKTGILYETPTKKQKLFQQKLKLALAETKKELLEYKQEIKQLDNLQKKELIAINNTLQKVSQGELSVMNNIKEEKDFNQNLYNSKNINSQELRDIEERLKENIDEEPVELGMKLYEVEQEHKKRFEELKNQFKIDEVRNRAELEEKQSIALKIIEKIKKKGWMDFFTAQRMCGTEKTFKEFLKLIDEHNIYDDGEDFRVKK